MMAGTQGGGMKTRDKLLSRDPLHYEKMGANGGKKSRGGGFAKLGSAWASEQGKKGGASSRRGVAKVRELPCPHCDKVLTNQMRLDQHIYFMHRETPTNQSQ